MSATFLTYLWHYLAARAIYDDFLRPLAQGRPTPFVLVAVIGAFAFLLGRWSAARRRP